ncbi:N-acetyltransferase [Candidatus Symbiopectobacterium sp. 'North America']|uniref:N-acetyltransferase n=1 Tax=Candidatus Symbiopectobacterium sp. 'North America' TaxID=2794574 RepID=UPI0035ABEB01
MPSFSPLWLESTTRSHPFINPTYWQESEPLVRELYIPNAETWVYEVEGAIVGFISVMEQRFVGALFVHHRWHSKGVGVALSLEVYEQNLRACAFYQKLGFSPVKRTFPAETNAPAQIMQWEKMA